MNQTLLRWDASARELRALTEDLSPARDLAPIIVDSWHVLDGQVRALHLHQQRFAAAGRELGSQVGADHRLWSAIRQALPRSGSWFPRVELINNGAPVVQLRLRPAPALAAQAVVWVPPEPDARHHPHLKGPDLPALLSLRADAGSYGASEALLCTADGIVVEASTSNVLWWDGDVLCFPDRSLPALRGVTEQLIIGQARRRQIPLSYRRVGVRQLLEHEVWLTNALHGIRPVAGWRVPDALAGVETSQRARQWRSWLSATRVTV